jgi:2-C-methyl-D-erythritol 4-phosphate cytidylyltransferase/2-C-methyl-D-erythritol 2,4-cyclodiphosphate synthase
MAIPSTAFADAVIVAAGASQRMAGVDKLSADLAGRPLLRWTVDAMASASSVAGLIVVVARDAADRLAGEPWIVASGARVVTGGERRQDSVRAGVKASSAEVVLVHDGARPFPDRSLVEAVAQAAARDGAAIPVLPVADTLKRVDGDRVVDGPPRTGLGRAQTPQGARRGLLLAAFASAGDGGDFSDEAALLAAAGVPVTAVPGDPENIKVTEPADLELARAIAASRVGPLRLGTGHDSHPFGPEDGLRLGGIEIAEAPRLAGHSDGDTALHAIADALLAATSNGDLGRLFPPGDPATRGGDSRQLLRTVVERIGAQGARPASVDLALQGARPHLGAERLDAMRRAIADLLDVPPERVSVTASTGNLSGDEGAGRVITAAALVTVNGR